MADTTPDAALPGSFDRRPSLQEALADEPRWTLILRGIAALMLGMIAFLMPGITFLMLIAIFAGYMLVDGILAIASGWKAGREGQRCWTFLLEGIRAPLAAGGAAERAVVSRKEPNLFWRR